MKANELMIGDWVVNPVHNDKCQIQGVFFDKELNCLVATDGRFPQEYFHPIPLTPEILEANDIKYQFGNPWYQSGYPELDKIEFRYENRNSIDVKIRIKYIHELQHALRLCGLNEIADNFKIK